MSGTGPDAELNYQLALREFSSDPKAAVMAVAEIYRETPVDQYVERWAQVNLLADLRSDATVSVFDDILATPIPPEKAPDMITFSTVGEETMIRTTAIEGLTRLAARGNRPALEVLRKHFQHEIFSVRRAAIQGYIEAGGQGARDELRKVLPQADLFILDIRRADVQDVPQPSIESTSDVKDQPPPPRIRSRIEE
jgi:hypothetical protein